MHIAVIGAGHVGLVCAASFAAVGHRVWVHDVDEERIADLQRGRVPFFEHGLEAVLEQGRSNGGLSFHTDPAEALPVAEVIFVCVPTIAEQDLPDLSNVVAASTAVARHASDGAVLVNRTTSPIGTLQMIRMLLDDEDARSIRVAANPEFLAEGSAVWDFLAPRRVVIGAWEQAAVGPVVEAFRPITQGELPPALRTVIEGRAVDYPIPVLITTPETAEVSKYSANAFLAVKISFINEIAAVSERFGADIDDVARALALDPRIGGESLRPGVGWGNGGFPRDLAALNADTETERVPTRLLSAASTVNDDQRCWVIETLQSHLRSLVDRRIGLLGLSYKPSTDDIRSSPSLEIATELVRAGATVVAYDPTVTRLPPPLEGVVEIAPDALSAAAGSDALVLVTEWDSFTVLPLDELRSVMRVPLFVDGRNAIDGVAARAAGLVYVGVGRRDSNVYPILPSPREIDRRMPDVASHGGSSSTGDEPGGPSGAGPSGAGPSGAGPSGGGEGELVPAQAPAAQVLTASGGAGAERALPEAWIAMPQPSIPAPRLEPVLPPRRIQAAVKRCVDIVVSLTMILALLPFVIVVATAIAVDSRGPVLFVQRRIGRNGRLFSLLKFRTMVADGEAVLAAHLESNTELLLEWERFRKLRDDPRVTRIGSFLRKYSVDELPQIVNVLRGQMSLVGPRPVTTDELELLGDRGPQIVGVRPGLTGLWAVSGRSDVSYQERAQLEYQYALEWSLWMDLKILMRTIPAVLRGRGAY